MLDDIDRTLKPFIFQKELNDYYVFYELNVYTRLPERMFHIKSQLHQLIQDNIKAAGIDMAVPQQIHIKP
jgi:small-conductance mechanosensitive channel